jgi:hypothetical protein
VTSDGPFAETSEVLTGFYQFECADLDEAIAWAAQIPAAWSGKVEVRPIAALDVLEMARWLHHPPAEVAIASCHATSDDRTSDPWPRWGLWADRGAYRWICQRCTRLR